MVESSVQAHGPCRENFDRGDEMEKQLSVLSYWLGLICTILALIFRLIGAANMVPPHLGVGGNPGNAISYISFFHGAALFFLLSIASWCRTAKS
jgi:hypothetical protein